MITRIQPRNVSAVFDAKTANWSAKGHGVLVSGNDSPLDVAAITLVRDGVVWADLGCGDGRTAAKIARSIRYGRAALVDLSREMTCAAADRLRQHQHVRTTVVVADATRTPLPNGYAELVVIRQLLQHVPDPTRVLREAARILRPGGTILVQVPGPRYFASWEPFTGSFETDRIGRFAPEELHALLSGIGLAAHVERHSFRFSFVNVVAAFRFLLDIGLIDKRFNYDGAPGQALDELLDDPFVTSPLRSTSVEVDGEYALGIGVKP